MNHQGAGYTTDTTPSFKRGDLIFVVSVAGCYPSKFIAMAPRSNDVAQVLKEGSSTQRELVPMSHIRPRQSTNTVPNQHNSVTNVDTSSVSEGSEQVSSPPSHSSLSTPQPVEEPVIVRRQDLFQGIQGYWVKRSTPGEYRWDPSHSSDFFSPKTIKHEYNYEQVVLKKCLRVADKMSPVIAKFLAEEMLRRQHETVDFPEWVVRNNYKAWCCLCYEEHDVRKVPCYFGSCSCKLTFCPEGLAAHITNSFNCPQCKSPDEYKPNISSLPDHFQRRLEADCLAVKVLPPPHQDGYYKFKSQGPDKPDLRILHHYEPTNNFGFQCCCDICRRSVVQDYLYKLVEETYDGEAILVRKRWWCNKILAPFYYYPHPDTPFPAEYKEDNYYEKLDDGIIIHHNRRRVAGVITIDDGDSDSDE